MTLLIIDRVLKDLCEKGKNYSAKIVDFEYGSHLGVCMDGAVWDLKTGHVLKLGEDKRVLWALKGFEKVESEEVKFEGDVEECERKVEENGFWRFSGMFGRAMVPIVCLLMSLHFSDEGLIRFKTIVSIAFDLLESYTHVKSNFMEVAVD
jgi:hypothetical protein